MSGVLGTETIVFSWNLIIADRFKDRLKMLLKTFANLVAHALRSQPCIPSSHAAFRRFTALKALGTSGTDRTNVQLFWATERKLGRCYSTQSEHSTWGQHVYVTVFLPLQCFWEQAIPHTLEIKPVVAGVNLVPVITFNYSDNFLQVLSGLLVVQNSKMCIKSFIYFFFCYLMNQNSHRNSYSA